MKWQFTLLLITAFSQFSVLNASEPSDEDADNSTSYHQLRAEFGFANWRLKNAGFLEMDAGTNLSSYGGYWMQTFKFNEKWGFSMGFGIQRQEAKLDAGNRSGEAFPEPFEFDDPQNVDAFTVEQTAFPIPLRVRHDFSKDGGLFVESGPEIGFGYLLNYHYSEGNKTTSYDLDDQTNFFKLDWDLDVGYNFNWGGELWSVGVNGFYQITPMLKDADLNMTPMGVNVYVQYEFCR